MKTLSSISELYLRQNNHMTSCPIWVCVPKKNGYPKVFILELEAEHFLADNADYTLEICSVPRHSSLWVLLRHAIDPETNPEQYDNILS